MKPSVAIAVSVALVACAGPKQPVAPSSGTDSTRIVSLTVSLARSVIDIGETVGAFASGYDERGLRQRPAAITWTSASPAVATVSAAGEVTGLTSGSAAIRATVDMMTASALVQVSAAHLGAQVDVSPSLAIIQRNASIQLTAVLRDSTGAIAVPQQVAWTSADIGMATVSNTGLVRALEEGTAVVSVILDSHSAYATIRITPVLSSIISIHLLAPDTLTAVSDSVHLIAVCTPERPLTKVVGRVGARTFAMSAVRIGALGGGEGWSAWVRMSDVPPGIYNAVVTVYDVAGATASDSVQFTRKVTAEGSGLGNPGFKIVLPP